MPASRNTSFRINTSELKTQIERNVGHERAQKYFLLLGKYLSGKSSKLEFDRQCSVTLGGENVYLHNQLIGAIIKNASLSKSPPPNERKTGTPLNVKVPNGYHKNSLHPTPKGRTPAPGLRHQKLGDRLSPLGPLSKAHDVEAEDSMPKIQEQQSATEMLSLGSRPPPEVNSVEEGEEVEQAAGSPSNYSRSPVRAPLGISINGKEPRKVLRNGLVTSLYPHSCLRSGELPNFSSLKTMLEKKLESEELTISTDCVNLLNNSLDVYLKTLIKPCLELATSRSGNKNSGDVCNNVTFGLNGVRPTRYVQQSRIPTFASLLDFRVAMESDPQRLGEDWPVQLEKICLRESYQE